MSSKNRPSIQALIGAIANGLNPSQTSDLVQKISDDLNEVHSWIDTGPLPRALTSAELGGNIAYTDKYDNFTVGISISGIDPSGVINVGDIVFDAVKGFIIKLKTGTTDDFELIDPAGNIIAHITTATKIVKFDGGIQTLGDASALDGSFSKVATKGLTLLGIAGTNQDFSLLTPGGANFLLRNPTGTTDIEIDGNISQPLHGKHFEFLERADPAAGAVNTGRLYCRDNGAGKTQLCIIFNTGAVQVIATQP